jgi:hypothetical protein
VLFVSGIHYMVHYTNLVVKTLSKLSLVSKITFLLASMYNYFVYNIKWHLEANKLVNFWKTKAIEF